MDQCHLCQAWVHPECFGEDVFKPYRHLVLRVMSTFVERLLESLFVKLERSNQELVSLTGEQNQEIRGLRGDIATSKRASRRRRRRQRWVTTGLWGTVCYVIYASSGNPIKIRKKSGAILADIEQIIDDAANTETIDEINVHRQRNSRNNE